MKVYKVIISAYKSVHKYAYKSVHKMYLQSAQ